MKAVIEVARRGSAVRTARAQMSAARRGKSPDFHLSFESARSLFADLTPARVELLDTLRKVGPVASTRSPSPQTVTIPTFTPMWADLKNLA